MVRELTLSQDQIQHPQVVDGKTLWVAPEVQDIIDRLQNGDPTLGWEGDARLSLYREEGRWVLMRLENDSQYRVVCRSKPGVSLDGSLILHLVAHDLRRKSMDKQLAEMDAHNDAIVKAQDAVSFDKTSEMLRKVYWAAGKDIGYHY